MTDSKKSKEGKRMIVNLAVRRQARAEEKFIEAQCLALEIGAHEIHQLIREGCELLQTPPPPVAPASNVVEFRARKAA